MKTKKLQILGSLSNGSPIVDSSLSTTSTNPVQNRVVSAEIEDIKDLIGDESVSAQISNAISSVQFTITGDGVLTLSS